MTLIPQGDQLAGEFAVYIATGTEAGAVSEVSRTAQPMKFPAGSEEQLRTLGTFEFKTALLIREGEQVVSVGLVDTVAGTAGRSRCACPPLWPGAGPA